jgi:DNA-binding SARP family transcriptional activator
MEWSHALLGAREQVLLRRLAVFAGGFGLDAAEAVCAGEPLEAEDILDGVAALVDKSLVVMEPGESVARYRLLETVRQYGLERLAEAGERDAVERRHAEHFLRVAETAAPRLFGGEHEAGLVARLAADDDNLRAATAWSVHADDRVPLALRFADALFWYWLGSSMRLGGQLGEARRFVGAALERAATVVPAPDPALRGRALLSCGLVGLAQGDDAAASAAFAEALALLRAHGDADAVTFALAALGAARLMLGDTDEAWALLDEAHARAEPLRPYGMLHSWVYSWRGMTARARGDLATARRMHEGDLHVGRLMRHPTVLGHGYAFLAAVELAEGHVDEAFARFCDALPYHLGLDDAWGLALDIEGLAAVAARRGRHADAARLLGAVDALRERGAVALPAFEAADRERRVAHARGRLGAAFDAAYAEGRALAMDDVVALATADAVVYTAEFRVPGAEPTPEAPGAPGAPGAACEADAVPGPARGRLRVLALGPLQVWVGDRLVEPAAWGAARPRELLVYLLLHPEGRTREQVGLAFWPDASAAQLRNNFHVTLHRLRRALGAADLVTIAHDRYVVDPAAVAEFDARDVERELAAATRALQRRQEGATAELERALARYRGDLLDGEPAGDWHLEHRDRLQRLYVDALMALGARHAAEGRQAAAAEAYRRVLARDELHEEALRGLMRCHAALGERSQALRAYHRFVDRLQRELEAEPGLETARLVQRLQQGAAT